MDGKQRFDWRILKRELAKLRSERDALESQLSEAMKHLEACSAGLDGFAKLYDDTQANARGVQDAAMRIKAASNDPFKVISTPAAPEAESENPKEGSSRHDELYRSFTVPPAPVLIPAEPPKNSSKGQVVFGPAPDPSRPDLAWEPTPAALAAEFEHETKTEKE